MLYLQVEVGGIVLILLKTMDFPVKLYSMTDYQNTVLFHLNW